MSSCYGMETGQLASRLSGNPRPPNSSTRLPPLTCTTWKLQTKWRSRAPINSWNSRRKRDHSKNKTAWIKELWQILTLTSNFFGLNLSKAIMSLTKTAPLIYFSHMVAYLRGCLDPGRGGSSPSPRSSAPARNPRRSSSRPSSRSQRTNCANPLKRRSFRRLGQSVPSRWRHLLIVVSILTFLRKYWINSRYRILYLFD